MADKTECKIHLLDRALHLRCEQDKLELLQRAALLFDAKLRELRDQQGIVSSERLAILAGLTLAQELLQTQDTNAITDDKLTHQLQQFNHQINQHLSYHEQITIFSEEEEESSCA